MEVPNRIVMPPMTTRLADRAGFDLVELHPLRGHHLRGGLLLQELVKSLPIYVVFFVVISLLIFFPALAVGPGRLRQADARAERPPLQDGGLRRGDQGFLRETRAAFRLCSRDRLRR